MSDYPTSEDVDITCRSLEFRSLIFSFPLIYSQLISALPMEQYFEILLRQGNFRITDVHNIEKILINFEALCQPEAVRLTL